MRTIRSRNAARSMLADHAAGAIEGFTFVEIVVGLLVVGIFAAIVVFSVATVTHHTPRPDPACADEVTKVNLAILHYENANRGKVPKDLGALVPHFMPNPLPRTAPSRLAGYVYDTNTGVYHDPITNDQTGAACPKR